MINVTVRDFRIVHTPSTSFSRTHENWHSLDPQVHTRASDELAEKLIAKEDHLPTIAIAPSMLVLRFTVRSSTRPQAYISMGGRGTYMLHLTPKTRDGTTLRPLEIAGINPSEIEWEFEGYVPLTSASSTSTTAWSLILGVVNEGGESWYDIQRLVLLKERLTPALDPQAAHRFVGEMANTFFLTGGLEFIYRSLIGLQATETWVISERDFPKDKTIATLKQWFEQYGRSYYGWELQQGYLDQWIPEQPWMKRAGTVMSYGQMVQKVAETAVTDWAGRLATEFVKDVVAGKWKLPFSPRRGTGLFEALASETTLVSDRQSLPEHLRQYYRWDASVFIVRDPGSEYGDEYLLITPKQGNSYIITAEGQRVELSGAVRDTTKSEPQPEAPMTREALRAEWELWMANFEIAYQVLKLIGAQIPREPHVLTKIPVLNLIFRDTWVSPWPATESLTFPTIMSPIKATALGLPALPSAPEQVRTVPGPSWFLSIPLPEVWKPALSQPAYLPLVDRQWIQSSIMKWAFEFWGADLAARYGPVRTLEEYNTIMDKALEMMVVWDVLNIDCLDCEQVTQDIQKIMSRGSVDPNTIALFMRLIDNCRDVQFRRLPDWMFEVPIYGWLLSKIQRYANLPWTYGEHYIEARRDVWEQYWPSTVQIWGNYYNAPELTMQYTTALLHLKRGASVPSEELAFLEDLAVKIEDSPEVKKRFPALANAAAQLLSEVRGITRPPFPAESLRYLTAPVDWELFAFENEPPTPELLGLVAQLLPPDVQIAGQITPETAVTTLRRQLAAELSEEWERRKEKEEISPKLVQEMRDKIAQARESFPDYISKHVGVVYTVDPGVLSSVIDEFMGKVLDGSLLNEALQALPRESDIQRTYTQVSSDRVTFQMLLHSMLRQKLVSFYADYARTKVFRSEEELRETLNKDLQDLFLSATVEASKAMGRDATDWLSVMRHVSNYAMGYTFWHHGQRLCTRAIISLLF